MDYAGNLDNLWAVGSAEPTSSIAILPQILPPAPSYEKQGEEMRSPLSLRLTESISNTSNPLSPLSRSTESHCIGRIIWLQFDQSVG